MGLELVKEAIDLLALDYYLIGKLTIENLVATKDTPIELSARPLKIVSISNDRKLLNPSCDYELDDNRLIFNDNGTYTIKYYAEPVKPNIATDNLTIPYEYQNCIAQYVSAITRARLFGQSDSNAVSFFQQFAEGATKANNAYIRKKTTGKRLPPRR